jgi:ribosome-binding ATPase YchF (GTP1/OBG family)
MTTYTSDQLITVIERIKAERSTAAHRGQQDDIAVLDEEIDELRLALLKQRWGEVQQREAQQEAY